MMFYLIDLRNKKKKKKKVPSDPNEFSLKYTSRMIIIDCKVMSRKR